MLHGKVRPGLSKEAVYIAWGEPDWHFGDKPDLSSFYNPLGGPVAFLSNWSAHALALPFLCLLAVAASLAAGDGRDLPLLVLAGGLLVHTHVARPLFVVPTTALAYGVLLARGVAAERRSFPPDGRFRWWLGAAWRATDGTSAPHVRKSLVFADMDWYQAIGVALQLERAGERR